MRASAAGPSTWLVYLWPRPPKGSLSALSANQVFLSKGLRAIIIRCLANRASIKPGSSNSAVIIGDVD